MFAFHILLPQFLDFHLSESKYVRKSATEFIVFFPEVTGTDIFNL